MTSSPQTDLIVPEFKPNDTAGTCKSGDLLLSQKEMASKVIPFHTPAKQSVDITRFFDIIIASLFLLLLLPVLLLIALLIRITSAGPVLFVQQRVGRNNVDFTFYKFRTMFVRGDENNFLTIGTYDKRITPLGVFLRRFKFDELPQLYNVLINDMSIVGPRPEVRKYVNLYTISQKKILALKPGITDYASIAFINESELLAKQANPEAYYIKKIMPLKIKLNRKYADNKTLKNYCSILLQTVFSVLR